MPAHNLSFCFDLPCDKSEGIMVLRAYDVLGDGFDTPPLQVSSLNFAKCNVLERIVSYVYYNHPDYKKSLECGESENPCVFLEWGFDVIETDGRTRALGLNGFDPEMVALFARAVLYGCDSEELIAIGFSKDCDEFCPDAFGGFGCVVSKSDIRWQMLGEFFDTEQEAWRKGEKHYIGRIVEVNGGIEHERKFLIHCAKEEKVNEKLRSIFVKLHGENVKELPDYVEFENGLIAKTPKSMPISPMVFKTMSEYLRVY